MDRARIKNAVVVIALLGAIWLISSKVSPPDSIMLKNFTGLNAGIRSPLENISRAYQAPVYSKEVAELARVTTYEKGYKGYRDDVYDSPVKTDYKLERPTKVEVK